LHKIPKTKKWEMTCITDACGGCLVMNLKNVFHILEYKHIKKKKDIFISFKTHAKRERDITWWNPAAQTCPVLDSSSFAPVLMLSRRICLHSASSILAARISCHVIAVFVFRKHLFVNKHYYIYVCYTNIMLYIAFGIICHFS
jgi:hypothetical protein